MKRQRTELVCSDLPEDCWEHVFIFLKEEDRYGEEEQNNRRSFKTPPVRRHYLNSLSLVSKHLLSITNRHKLSLRVLRPTLPFLPRLFHRFTNLTSLDLSQIHCDLNDLLVQISRFSFNRLTSLDISYHSALPAIGLRAFSSKVATTLTSLTCFNLGFINIPDDFKVISDCFPLLQQLDIGYPKKYEVVNLNHTFSLSFFKALTCLDLEGCRISDHLLASIAMERPPLRRLFLGLCTGYTYSGILALLTNCLCIEDLNLESNDFLTDHHVAELSSFLGHLVSINLNDCMMLTDSAFFALIRNCPKLSRIIFMFNNEENILQHSNSLMDYVVYPQIKSLYLGHNYSLRDENIIMYASIFPNLQFLNLTRCSYISEEGIGQVLRRCRKIRHLNLASCSELKSLGMNFELPKLEVLNLSNTSFNDEALYIISKRCRGLLQLSLKLCKDITKNGVIHVVKNCTILREIILDGCSAVDASVVALMLFLRPSLRKIAPPPDFPFSDRNRKLFLRRGCILNFKPLMLKFIEP